MTSRESTGSPITSEGSDVITPLQAKREGLEADRRYSKDGDTQVWKRSPKPT